MIVHHGLSEDSQLRGFYSTQTSINELTQGLVNPTTENVKVGGNSIVYPLNEDMDLKYHVYASEVKQEFVLDKLSSELRDSLQGQLDEVKTVDSEGDLFFGLQEVITLPKE